MQFGLDKCLVLGLKSGEIVKINGFAFPIRQMMKEICESGYKYLAKKKMDMKDKFASEYNRRLKLVLKSRLIGRNKISGINTWAATVLK